MNLFFKIAALVAMMFVTITASAENSQEKKTIRLNSVEICKFFALDAIDLAQIRADGGTDDDLMAWIKDRIDEDPAFRTFLPGNILITSVLMDLENDHRITDEQVDAFGKTTFTACMQSIGTGMWIQEVPGSSNIIEPEQTDSGKVYI